MNCIDCRYSLLKDGHSKCTYEEGECIKISVLEKENAELRAKNKWYSEQVCNKECAEVWGNLDKAKEIIKKFSEFINNEVEYDPEHPQEHTDLWNKLCEQAEQFLKKV